TKRHARRVPLAAGGVRSGDRLRRLAHDCCFTRLDHPKMDDRLKLSSTARLRRKVGCGAAWVARALAGAKLASSQAATNRFVFNNCTLRLKPMLPTTPNYQ